MNQSNYALLTALYDSQSSDLYKDIYFPIIKYGIFLLYQKQIDATQYYDTTNIQEVIIEKFGVKIPLIVIKQSLKIISNEHPDFKIELLHNGDQFSIKKTWDVVIADSIERVYEQNLKHFTALQNTYAQYIEAEQLQTKVNFIDFFSDNTEDIYHYINNDTTSELVVNENYIHIVNFLKWIKEYDTNLYDIAADIFWGSIITAFLQREINLNIKPEIRGCDATGFYNSDGFTVLKGSVIVPKMVPSFKWKEKREKMLREYTMFKGAKLIMTSDKTFSSPSTAADFCIGSSNNGWLVWKDKDGNTLDSVYRKQLE